MKRPLEASAEGRGRIVGITDGVFAIALTLIVLEIRVPAHETIHSEHDLLAAIAALAPRFLTYALELPDADHLLVRPAGAAWADRQIRQAARHAEPLLSRLHRLVPFSTDLLADFLEFRTAVLVYWLNLLMLGVTLFASWRYAEKNGFIAEDVDAETRRTVYLRIVKAQILWAVGAALCLVSPLLSVGFILVVQLIYAAALRGSLLRNVIG